MQDKTLAKELATKIRKYRTKAKEISIDENSLGNTVFTYENGETMFNPKYLKVAEYFDLKALEAFLKTHTTLTEEEVVDILNRPKKEFEFLREFNVAMPDMIELVKNQGAKPAAIAYISRLLYPNTEELEV